MNDGDGLTLPAGTHPGPVRLQVSDLERSLAFYQTVLGMRVLDQGPGLASLGAQDDDRLLVALHERPGAAPVGHGRRLGLYHFALLLPERAALGRFVGHLAEAHVQVGAADHLVSEALYLQDPDGLGIEVYADRPRESWRMVDGELAMASDRLDLPGLARAGGGSPWRGMPAGTVMGHVHLHVGDLDAAEAFYARGLGLEAMVRSYPGALFLAAGGYHHHLGLNTWAAGAPPPSADDARLLEWTLVLPRAETVRAAARRLQAQGATIQDQGPDALRATDPWGTAVRLEAEA